MIITRDPSGLAWLRDSTVIRSKARRCRPPDCALVLTSPPYGSFRTGEHDDDPATYLADARRLFSGFAQFLTADATLAVEVSQVREEGRTRPLVWQLSTVLGDFIALREDLVWINMASAEAGPGYDHSHVLVFRPLS
jgi:hypothetical protein